MRREADDTGPYAEFEHWRQLNARFNSVLEQIRSHDCRMAIQILHISKSKILKVTACCLSQTVILQLLLITGTCYIHREHIPFLPGR